MVPREVRVGRLGIDLSRYAVRRENRPAVTLSGQEHAVLLQLMRQPGWWVPHAHLLGPDNNPGGPSDIDTLRTVIWRLRKAIDDDGRLIEAGRGGYRLDEIVAAQSPAGGSPDQLGAELMPAARD
jgi:DNA-binding response OmpR family regulator